MMTMNTFHNHHQQQHHHHLGHGHGHVTAHSYHHTTHNNNNNNNTHHHQQLIVPLSQATSTLHHPSPPPPPSPSVHAATGSLFISTGASTTTSSSNMDTDNISGIFNSSIRNNDSRRSWPLSPILSATRGKLSTPQPPLLLSTGTMAGMATEAAAAAQLSHNLPPSPNSPTFGGAPIIPCSTSQQWTMLGGPTTSHLTPQPSPGRTQAYPALFPPVTTTSPTHSTALAFRGRPSSPSVWSEPIGPHAASPFPLVRRDSAPVQIRELSKEACEWGAVRPYSLSKHNSSFEGDKFLRATASLPFEALSSVDQAFSSESGANRTPVFRTNAVGRAESAVEHPRGRRAPPSEGCNGSHTGSSAAGAVVPSQCYGGGPVPTPPKRKHHHHHKHKTEMCRSWEELGTCVYGSQCQFAHSEDELRTVRRHPLWRTEYCKTFWKDGFCLYGRRCSFIHYTDDAPLFSSAKSIKTESGPVLSLSTMSEAQDRIN